MPGPFNEATDSQAKTAAVSGQQWLALLVAVAAYGGLAYATPRAKFGQLLLLFGLALGSYLVLLRWPLPLRWGLAAALGLRLLWLPAAPALSDDVYRFRWDGLLVAHGISPFLYRPAEIIADGGRRTLQTAQNRDELMPELAPLYRKLNSPNYYSVYPPVCQYIYGAAARVFPHSEAAFTCFLRLVIVAAEAGTAWLLLALLARWQLPATRAYWYLLHPLSIIELTGNLHIEAVVSYFLLLAFYFLTQRRRWQSASALALSVATKLLPLLLLPLLVRKLGWQQFIRYCLLTGLGLASLFIPFISPELIKNISRGLQLYFHNFEFNASVYYVLRPIGYWLTGYNQIAVIGPALAGLAATFTLLLAYRAKGRDIAMLPGLLLLSLTAYYLLATTVHPWYLTLLLALSVFTHLRFPRVWAGLAMLSYAAYQSRAYPENLWLVGLEYVGVAAVMLLDFKRSQHNSGVGRMV